MYGAVGSCHLGFKSDTCIGSAAHRGIGPSKRKRLKLHTLKHFFIHSTMPKARAFHLSCPDCPPRPSNGVFITLYLALLDTTTQHNEETGVKAAHYHWGYLMIHWDALSVTSYKLKQPFAPWRWWKYDKPQAYKGNWPDHTFPVAHLGYDGDVSRMHITCEKTIKSVIPGATADQDQFKECPCYSWVDRIARALERKGYIDADVMDAMEQWCNHMSHGETSGRRSASVGPSVLAASGTAPTYDPGVLSNLNSIPPYSALPAEVSPKRGAWTPPVLRAPATAPYPYSLPVPDAYPAQGRYAYPTAEGSYSRGSDPCLYRTYAAAGQRAVKYEDEPLRGPRSKQEHLLY